MAAGTLASASPRFCSVLLLLPPSKQAQHFKSRFLTAGKESRSIFCAKRRHRLDCSFTFSFLCVAPPIRGINISASILPVSISLTSDVTGNYGPGAGLL